ncbi:hypothetical protein GDO81_019441, partial [Engystomops pustulosus]
PLIPLMQPLATTGDLCFVFWAYVSSSQLMEASQNGRSGVRALEAVARGSKNEPGCVITPLQPMVEDPAWAERWTCERAACPPAQWTGAGPAGAVGLSVQQPAVTAPNSAPDPASPLPHKMVGRRALERTWKPRPVSCHNAE